MNTAITYTAEISIFLPLIHSWSEFLIIPRYYVLCNIYMHSSTSSVMFLFVWSLFIAAVSTNKTCVAERCVAFSPFFTKIKRFVFSQRLWCCSAAGAGTWRTSWPRTTWCRWGTNSFPGDSPRTTSARFSPTA